jgi:hypothetical protein
MNVVESFLDQKLGTVVIDAKGSPTLGRQVVDYARARGTRAYFFDGTRTYSDAAAYNPFASGDHTTNADKIVSIHEYSDSFYETEAVGFAQMDFRGKRVPVSSNQFACRRGDVGAGGRNVGRRELYPANPWRAVDGNGLRQNDTRV